MHQFMDILILALISVVLGIKLFSILGQKRDRDHVNGESPYPDSTSKSPSKTIKDVEVKIDSTIAAELQLPLLDKSFDKARFISNSREAFKMILEAYAKGNTTVLSKLLNVSMMRKVAYKIVQREAHNHICEINILQINEAYIEEIIIQGSTAEIKVSFEAEIINSVTDAAGKIVAGDKVKIEKIKDFWIFSRNLKSSDPTWALANTKTLFA